MEEKNDFEKKTFLRNKPHRYLLFRKIREPCSHYFLKLFSEFFLEKILRFSALNPNRKNPLMFSVKQTLFSRKKILYKKCAIPYWFLTLTIPASRQRFPLPNHRNNGFDEGFCLVKWIVCISSMCPIEMCHVFLIFVGKKKQILLFNRKCMVKFITIILLFMQIFTKTQ